MFCVHCGTYNDPSCVFCTSCGAPIVKQVQSDTVDRQQVSRKNPTLAVVFSFLIPGAGLIYMEKVFRGLVVLIVTTLTILLLFGLVSWIYGIYEAYMLSIEWNRKLDHDPYVRPWGE